MVCWWWAGKKATLTLFHISFVVSATMEVMENGCINPWTDTFILLFRSDSSVEIIFGIWSLFSWLSGRATLIFIFCNSYSEIQYNALQCSIDVHVMYLPKSTRLNLNLYVQHLRIFNISMFNLYFRTVWWLQDLWIISTTPPGKIFINTF